MRLLSQGPFTWGNLVNTVGARGFDYFGMTMAPDNTPLVGFFQACPFGHPIPGNPVCDQAAGGRTTGYGAWSAFSSASLEKQPKTANKLSGVTLRFCLGPLLSAGLLRHQTLWWSTCPLFEGWAVRQHPTRRHSLIVVLVHLRLAPAGWLAAPPRPPVAGSLLRRLRRLESRLSVSRRFRGSRSG
jgi:hypothetical protein